MKRTILAVLTLLLMNASSTAAQVLPDCGGLGERSCRPWDKEFWSMNSLTCEYDLKLSGTRCKENNRSTEADSAGWIGWAMREQRRNIQGTIPVNWATHFGTHNSYSSIRQGFVHIMAANQYYSITDQLQLGARFLRLDPHWYYDNLRLCHGENKHQCATTAPGRLFAMGVKEISDWLKYHDDIVLLQIHDSALGQGDDPTKHPKHVLEPVREYLGPKVLKPGDWDVASRGWPTLDQMKAMGKQIIIFATHQYSVEGDDFYGDEGFKGEQWFFKHGTYFMGSYRVDEFDPASCKTDGDDARQRDSKQWWFLGEGRTGSDQLSGFTGFLDEPQVRQALKCGVSYLGVDYLMARDKVLYSPYGGLSTDKRREASIWSWKEGEYALKGPAQLRRRDSGRWVSETPTIVEQAACGRRNPNSNRPWRVAEWRITTRSGNWFTGANLCNEFNTGGESGWVFAAPRSAEENDALYAQMQKQNVDVVWINYAARPVPEPVASPAYLSFEMLRGGPVPAPETVRLYSGPDVQFTAANVENRPWLRSSARLGVAQPEGIAITVGVDPARAANYAPGSYPDSIAFARVNPPAPLPGQPPVARRPGYVSGHLHIFEPTSSSIELLNRTAAVPAGTPAQVKITITSPRATVNDYTTGVVRLVRVVDVVEDGATRKDMVILAEKPVEPTNNVTSSVTFDVQLPPGLHTLVGGYRGDDKHAPSHSDMLRLNVVSAPRLTPAAPIQLSWVIGESVPPGLRMQMSDQTTGQPVKSTWSVKYQQGQLSGWMDVSPAAGSATSVLNLVPNVLEAIGPRYLPGTVEATREDSGVAVSRPVTLAVLAPSLDGLPPSFEVSTGVFHRETIWLSRKFRFPVTAKAETANGKPWLKLTHTANAMNATLEMDPYGLPKGTYTGSVVFTSEYLKGRTVRVPVTMNVVTAVQLAIRTNIDHSGVKVRVNGQVRGLPVTLESYAGAKFEIEPLYESNTFLRFGFLNWSDGGAQKHTVTLGSTATTVQLNSWRDLLVRRVVVGSGSITMTPASPDGFYREGTVVQVHAVPAPGWFFAGWSGSLSGSSRTQTLKVVLNHTIQARFARP